MPVRFIYWITPDIIMNITPNITPDVILDITPDIILDNSGYYTG